MLNLLIWIFVGGCIGLAGSFLMYSFENPGLRANVLAGIAGAVLGGLLLAPLLRYSPFNPAGFSYPALMMAMLGSMSLVPTLHLARQPYRRR